MTEAERWDVYLTGPPTKPGPGLTDQEALAQVLQCDLQSANTALAAIPVRVGRNLERAAARRIFNAIGFIGGTARAVPTGAAPPTDPVRPTGANRALPQDTGGERTVIPRRSVTAPHRLAITTGAEQVVTAQEAAASPRASTSASRVAIVGTVTRSASGSQASLRPDLTSGSSYAIPKAKESGGGWIVPAALFVMVAAALVIVPMRLKQMNPVEVQQAIVSAGDELQVDVEFEFASAPRDPESFSIWLSGPGVASAGTTLWAEVSAAPPATGTRYQFSFEAEELLDSDAADRAADLNIAFDGQTHLSAPVDISALE